MSEQFVDVAEFEVVSGDGGDGCTSFESHPYQPRGGPDGGDGGEGGSVFLKADEELSTLRDISYKNQVEAEDGEPGGPKNQKGASGDDVVLLAPSGTVAYRLDTGERIGEIKQEGDCLTLAEGGDGGRGNRCFTNSQRQSPRFNELGAPGERIPVRLELKILADVGIIGKPNAGKSTLLSALTSASPKVASHEFTTVSPNLGVMFRDHERLTLCDVPGLIQDAHKGSGLGIEFLRHAERTEILLQLVDLSSPHPVVDYRIVREEIEQYNPELARKPCIVVANKIDKVETELVQMFREEIDAPGPIISISAKEGIGLQKLSNLLFSTRDFCREPSERETSPESSETVYRMEQRQPISVHKAEDRFILTGDEVERLVRRFDLSNPEAQSYVRERLLSMELHKKLERAGCEPGDTIQVGNQVFDYTG